MQPGKNRKQIDKNDLMNVDICVFVLQKAKYLNMFVLVDKKKTYYQQLRTRRHDWVHRKAWRVLAEQ